MPCAQYLAQDNFEVTEKYMINNTVHYRITARTITPRFDLISRGKPFSMAKNHTKTPETVGKLFGEAKNHAKTPDSEKG
jgi:hypothetical protein